MPHVSQTTNEFAADAAGLARGYPKTGSHVVLTEMCWSCNIVDNAPTPRVLVAERDPVLLDLMARSLAAQEFKVRAVAHGLEVLEQVRRWSPHVVVLDVALPDAQGQLVAPRLSVCPTPPPTLFLSPGWDVGDLRGLTVAGNDCLTRPFSLEELGARLRALLRRHGVGEGHSSRMLVADLELDEDTFEVFRGGRSIALSATEFRLLRYLMRNARHVVSRRQLVDHVWSYDFAGDTRVLNTYIGYLRKKIDSGETPLLHTVRDRGYRLGRLGS